MKLFAILLLATLAVVAACSPNTAIVRSTAVLGVVLYSDDEYAALKTHKVTVDDLAASLSNASATKLMPQTKVAILRDEQVPVASDVAQPVQWPFERVRVASGPAVGREGWVSTRQAWDGQPAFETSK